VYYGTCLFQGPRNHFSFLWTSVSNAGVEVEETDYEVCAEAWMEQGEEGGHRDGE